MARGVDDRDLEVINQRFTDLEKNITTKFDAVIDQMKTINDGIQKQIDSNKKEIDNLYLKSDKQLETDIAILETQSAHGEKIGSLEATVKHLQGNSELHFEEMKTANKDLDELAGKIRDIEGQNTGKQTIASYIFGIIGVIVGISGIIFAIMQVSGK